MLELVSTKKQVKLNDVMYNLKSPTKLDFEKNEQHIKNAENDGRKILDIYCDFMVDMGLPKEIVDSLELDHIQKIAQYLLGVEKK